MGFDVDKFLNDGYLILEGYYEITTEQLELSDSLMTDYEYKIGRRHVNNNPSTLPLPLRKLVVNKEISSFFNSLESSTIACRDIMITNEYKSDVMERNRWLHFDRWRSYKAMVYLSDVGGNSGPFSVVPGTHRLGAKLRRASSNKPYVHRKNRIELDYPEYLEKPVKLCGSSGTLILFDSDIFHQGGGVTPDHQRTLIRSHWYKAGAWREWS